MRCSASRCGFPEPASWAGFRPAAAGVPISQTALPDYRDLARENRTFEAITAEARRPLSMRTDGAAEQVWALLVSGNYLTTLRARPLLGRLITEADGAGADPAVVVSERFWKERLGGAPIAGRTLPLNGRLFSIAGVMPEGFQGLGGLYEPDLWLPLDRLDLLGLSPALTSRTEEWLSLAGRLKPGVTAAQAQADLRGIMSQLALAYPQTNAGRSVTFFPVSEGVPELRMVARVAWIAMAVVGIVLLIACFNVAGSAAGARLGTAARNRRANRARREPGPDPPAARHRRPAARGDQRRRRADPLGMERRPAVRVQPSLTHPPAPPPRLQ